MSTTGTPLNLNLFASGVTGWGTGMDANFSILNTAIAALQAGGTTGPAGAQGPAGPVGMIFAGQWTSTTAYVVPDVVTYNGSTYIAIANSTNTQPDINPNTWQLIAAAGAAGPAGPTGPQGPQGASGGGGTTVAFPIAIAEGGTGATTAAAARAALVAAASGVNSDITSLQSIATTGDSGTQVGINIVGTGGGDPDLLAIQVTDGTTYSSWQANGIISCYALNMSGNLLCGGGTFAGGIVTNTIQNGTPDTPVTVGQAGGNPVALQINNGGIALTAPSPVVAAGQIGLGNTVAATATSGGGQAVPGTVLGYILGYDGTTPIKIPYFAA